MYQNDNFRRFGVIHEFGSFTGRLTSIIDVFIITYFAHFTLNQAISASPALKIVDLVLYATIALLVGSLLQLSRSWRLASLQRELIEVISYWTTTLLAMLIALRLLGQLPIGEAGIWLAAAGRCYVSTLVVMLSFRVGLRLSLRHIRAYGHDQRTAAFIGATPTSSQLGDSFAQQRWIGIDVIGTFDDRSGEDGRHGSHAQIAGTVDTLVTMARTGHVSQIYVALPMAAEVRVRQIIDRFADTTASVYYCPPMATLDLVGGRWDEVEGQPVISVVESPFRGYSRTIKRAEDLLLLAIALPLAVLPLIACAIAVRLSSPGPILFRQTRYGLDGKPFPVLKFRTMYVAETDQAFVQATRGDPRVTRVGAVLRRTSLDELPQLLNVLGGSMSVVGPRPHPVKLNEEFRGQVRRYMVRHKIKPGITGLAQVSGARGETDSLDKMIRRIEFDLQYIRSWSPALDLRILARTLAVPFHKNAY
jgi:putative colanic acid biosynthesis UDP-glucose lipid carrier transferase